jgi:hypothetical protein
MAAIESLHTHLVDEPVDLLDAEHTRRGASRLPVEDPKRQHPA